MVFVGIYAAWHYHQADLTLSHYDARGHLVVARRVFDNLMPGWMQLGAVWLPVPHLLNAIPVQWDWSYQTGATGVAWSITFMAVGLALLARLVARSLESSLAGAAVAAAIGLNPNVLYLQSTPMTEPLLFGLTFVAWFCVDRYVRDATPETAGHAGLVLAALVLTRYEGWLIGVALGTIALCAQPRLAWRVAAWPTAALGAFLLHSYGSTGQWFTTGGFFEPNNPALGNPALAWTQITEAAATLGHPQLVLLGGLGIVALLACVAVEWRHNRPAALATLLPLALYAATALPLYAFTSGHPVRVRYMISLVVASTVLAVWLVRWLPRPARGLVAVAAAVWGIVVTPPFDSQAPMVQEAQWERPHSRAREVVTRVLRDTWDGTPVMASMGSLGHYMQQMSTSGFALKHFLHEGNGEAWKAAIVDPTPYVRWILIEETAEGGDEVAQRARRAPSYLAAFERVAEGGGVALYRRK